MQYYRSCNTSGGGEAKWVNQTEWQWIRAAHSTIWLTLLLSKTRNVCVGAERARPNYRNLPTPTPTPFFCHLRRLEQLTSRLGQVGMRAVSYEIKQAFLSLVRACLNGCGSCHNDTHFARKQWDAAQSHTAFVRRHLFYLSFHYFTCQIMW